jgi:hypothetical protein
MNTPDYVKILKLDKLALKSKTKAQFDLGLDGPRQQAKFLGVEASFTLFAERAWTAFGAGELGGSGAE